MKARHARVIRRGILSARTGRAARGSALERDAHAYTRWRKMIRRIPPRAKRPAPIRHARRTF